jgi:hypothetical protein
MVGRLLSESKAGSLLGAFEKVEPDKLGVGTHERLHGLMDGCMAISSPVPIKLRATPGRIENIAAITRRRGEPGER